MLKVGDKFRVRKRPPAQPRGPHWRWTDDMERFCGNVYEIVDIRDGYYAAEISGYLWYFMPDWTEPLSRPSLFGVAIGPVTNPDSIPEVYRKQEDALRRSLELNANVVELTHEF